MRRSPPLCWLRGWALPAHVARGSMTLTDPSSHGARGAVFGAPPRASLPLLPGGCGGVGVPLVAASGVVGRLRRHDRRRLGLGEHGHCRGDLASLGLRRVGLVDLSHGFASKPKAIGLIAFMILGSTLASPNTNTLSSTLATPGSGLEPLGRLFPRLDQRPFVLALDRRSVLLGALTPLSVGRASSGCRLQPSR